MRVLVASGPGSGHLLPLLSFVDALTERGDEVLLVVAADVAATVRATGQPYRVGDRPPAELLDPLRARFATAPPREAAIIANREIFGRLHTAAMLPAVEEAVTSFAPHVVLREPCEYASAITAIRSGIPHLQIGISQAAVEASSTGLVEPALAPYGDDVVPSLLAAPYLTRFPASLDPSPYTTTWRYREPADTGRQLPNWWPDRTGPLVYVTFGSVSGSIPAVRSVYAAALGAVADVEARVLVTVGPDVAIDELEPLPPNVHVEPWVPQVDVLTEAVAVVCHGGSGTTFGTLAAGIPLVLVPMFADQRPNAERVARLGAGVVVTPPPRPGGGMTGLGPDDVARLRSAIGRVLTDPSFGAAAGRIAIEMAAAPTIPDVLDRIDELVA